MTKTRHLAFPGLVGRVVLPDDPALFAGLRACLKGWAPGPAPDAAPAGDHGDKTLCTLHRSRRGGCDGDPQYDLRSPFLASPLTGLPTASAICGIIADLAQSFFTQRAEWSALHCGAFSIGGRLVAITGPARAGKSTLISRLSAEPGVTVFCDDVLPLRPDGMGMALGCAPRLRRPLPAGASDRFRAHVDRWSGPQDARYGYLVPPSLAPHGTCAPLSAFVVLDRREAAPARLHWMDRAEALRHVLVQNMADADTAAEAVARAERALSGVLCLRLVYADLEDATDLLTRAFALPAGVATPVAAALPPLTDAPGVGMTPVAPAHIDPSHAWRQARGVGLRRIGGEAFLWQPGGTLVFHLNPVALAVWALLADPLSADEGAALLAEAFPDTDPARIRADLEALIGAMAAADLICPAQDAD